MIWGELHCCIKLLSWKMFVQWGIFTYIWWDRTFLSFPPHNCEWNFRICWTKQWHASIFSSLPHPLPFSLSWQWSASLATMRMWEAGKSNVLVGLLWWFLRIRMVNDVDGSKDSYCRESTKCDDGRDFVANVIFVIFKAPYTIHGSPIYSSSSSPQHIFSLRQLCSVWTWQSWVSVSCFL